MHDESTPLTLPLELQHRLFDDWVAAMAQESGLPISCSRGTQENRTILGDANDLQIYIDHLAEAPFAVSHATNAEYADELRSIHEKATTASSPQT